MILLFEYLADFRIFKFNICVFGPIPYYLSNDKVLDCTKFKAFADNTQNVAKIKFLLVMG